MTHNNMTWHVTCCSRQDSQDSSFYRTCFGRNSAWTSGPACSSSNWCPNKSLITSLLRPVVTCHSIPPPRLTAARPGFIKSIATPPSCPQLLLPCIDQTCTTPGLTLSSTPVTIQTPEHSREHRTGELEHLPDQYCHSIGCPLSCPASICTLDFATWPSSAGQKTVKISAFLLKRKILQNI